MVSQSPDTSWQAERVQIELIRKSSVSKRISRVRSLSQTAIYLARRAVKRTNPSFSDREVDMAFVANHYGDKLAECLRSYIERKQL